MLLGAVHCNELAVKPTPVPVKAIQVPVKFTCTSYPRTPRPLVISGVSQANVTRFPTVATVGLRGVVGVAAHEEVTMLHGPAPYSFTARTRNITDKPDGIPEMN